MKAPIFSARAPVAIGPYSQAVRQGDVLYLSGQLPINQLKDELISDFTAAVHQVMKNIGHILHEAQMDFSHVLKVTVFLKNMKQYSQFNEVYSKYFSEPYPARSVVEVSSLPKKALLEMDVIAHV